MTCLIAGGQLRRHSLIAGDNAEVLRLGAELEHLEQKWLEMTKADIEGTSDEWDESKWPEYEDRAGPLIDAILNCIGAQWGTEFDFPKLRPIAAIMARYDVGGVGQHWPVFTGIGLVHPPRVPWRQQSTIFATENERALWTLITKSAHYFRRRSPVISKAFAVHQMG